MAPLILTIVLFIVGLLLIIKGGDWFVDAATWLAEISGIPKFLIGATVVSMATTLPELLVSIFATAKGSYGIAVGNAVGSVTANTALIFALSLIFAPALVNRKQFGFKGFLLIGSIAALYVLSVIGGSKLYWYFGLILLGILAVFVAENIKSAKAEAGASSGSKRRPENKKEIVVNVSKFVLGAAGIVIGADLLCDYGEILAVDYLKVPASIVGVTMIAIGTSLPELVTAITSLVKKQGALTMGNILGANIIDLTLILPVCALVSGGSLEVDAQSMNLDMPMCLICSAIAVIPTVIFGKTKRWQGITLVVFYAAYLFLLIKFFI